MTICVGGLLNHAFGVLFRFFNSSFFTFHFATSLCMEILRNGYIKLVGWEITLLDNG